jgi:hypothetical protein
MNKINNITFGLLGKWDYEICETTQINDNLFLGKIKKPMEGIVYYNKNGLINRTDGPAIYYGGCEWWVHEGLIHNINGPALLVKGVEKTFYFFYGQIYYTIEEWEEAKENTELSYTLLMSKNDMQILNKIFNLSYLFLEKYYDNNEVLMKLKNKFNEME